MTETPGPWSVAACPACGSAKLRVIDSRPRGDYGFATIRRRRVCGHCGHRFFSIEVAEELARIADLRGLIEELEDGG